MPRKLELTFQRGADGRVGRWKKFNRGMAYYLGSGRGKSNIDSYRETATAWKALKVKLDAELVPLPRAHDAAADRGDLEHAEASRTVSLRWSRGGPSNAEAGPSRADQPRIELMKLAASAP